MRTLLPTFAFVLLAAPALAGSIEPISGAASAGGSVSTIDCSDCPALKPRRDTDAYHVDAIEPGTQKIEVREADGELKIFRTEAWMGGSPVLFVSKAPAETVEAAGIGQSADGHPEAAETVDAGAKTGALDSSVRQQAARAEIVSSREFDPAGFELRVN